MRESASSKGKQTVRKLGLIGARSLGGARSRRSSEKGRILASWPRLSRSEGRFAAYGACETRLRPLFQAATAAIIPSTPTMLSARRKL